MTMSPCLAEICRYLCDEALDTEALREALSQRVDGAEEVKKEMREDMAGDKRKLKVRQLARCCHAHQVYALGLAQRHMAHMLCSRSNSR